MFFSPLFQYSHLYFVFSTSTEQWQGRSLVIIRGRFTCWRIPFTCFVYVASFLFNRSTTPLHVSPFTNQKWFTFLTLALIEMKGYHSVSNKKLISLISADCVVVINTEVVGFNFQHHSRPGDTLILTTTDSESGVLTNLQVNFHLISQNIFKPFTKQRESLSSKFRSQANSYQHVCLLVKHVVVLLDGKRPPFIMNLHLLNSCACMPARSANSKNEEKQFYDIM